MPPERLSDFMKRLNFETATSLANALGVNRDTVTRWMTGETKIPKMACLAMSAIAFGLKPME